MNSPKVLSFDIETLPVIASSFVLWNANISHDSIIQPTSLLSAAWQFLDQNGEPQSAMKSASILDDIRRFDKDIYDDELVVRALYDAMNEADVYLYHNGDRFDRKKFNTRALFHKLEPLPPKQGIDTLKQAKKHFAMDRNRLDFIGRFLEVGEKLHTGGMELWNNIRQYKYPSAGKEPDRELAIKAVKFAVKYNRQDVRLLNEVFKTLRPWIDLPNFSLYLGKVAACIYCGGQDYVRNGWRYTPTGKYQRYRCRGCKKSFDPPRSMRNFYDVDHN